MQAEKEMDALFEVFCQAQRIVMMSIFVQIKLLYS